jgi:hypothetical protein
MALNSYVTPDDHEKLEALIMARQQNLWVCSGSGNLCFVNRFYGSYDTGNCNIFSLAIRYI